MWMPSADNVLLKRPAGSGCVFEIGGWQVYVLTAAHVVTDARCRCEFWSQGHQSTPLAGVGPSRTTRPADVALVAVPVAAFEGRLPAAISGGAVRLPGPPRRDAGFGRLRR